MSTPTPSLVARLGAMILICEAVVVFLAGLSIYGLNATPEGVPAWWGIVGGIVMMVLMILTGAVIRFRWGLALAWILQLVVLAAAVLNPAIAIVAIVFGGFLLWAVIAERRIARSHAAPPTESE